MTVRVVDALEVVEVEKEHGEIFLASHAPLDSLAQGDVQVPIVEELSPETINCSIPPRHQIIKDLKQITMHPTLCCKPTAEATMTTAHRRPGHILIFLDIDGVLLPFPERNESSCGALFPDDCMAALSSILEALPHARLVLSSTWRAKQNLIDDILDSFYKYAKAKGGPLTKIQEFADTTDRNYHTERQHEIYKYLFYDNEDKVAAWVALDDEELLEGESNAKYREHFEGHAVKTSSRIGLTEVDAQLAVKLIKEQLEED